MKVLFASLALLVAPAAFAGDECEAQIPQSLRSAIELKYPTFRTPLVTDNSPDDVEWYRRKKRNPCLGVAVADFDGDGGKDVLLALVERNGPGYVVVVAFSKRTTWDLSQLDKREDGRLNLYVSADKPGTYKRTEALDGSLGPGEANPLTCSSHFAVFGTTESSGVAYCYKGGAWGCRQCRQTGYLGRIGIFEVMPMDERLRDLTNKAASLVDIQKAAMAGGMRTLQQSAIDKMLRGITTLEEVLRVTVGEG